MEYYSTMLHEMTHSTMTPERLNREMGGRFGDPKYAKEELVAELTAAMISHSMGFDSRITDNSAAYLDSWIGVLKQEPKFIVSVMADVNKASDLILTMWTNSAWLSASSLIWQRMTRWLLSVRTRRCLSKMRPLSRPVPETMPSVRHTMVWSWG